MKTHRSFDDKAQRRSFKKITRKNFININDKENKDSLTRLTSLELRLRFI